MPMRDTDCVADECPPLFSATSTGIFGRGKMAVDVVFRIPAGSLEDLLSDLTSEFGLEPQIVRPAGASGGGDLVTVLVALTPAVLTFLGVVVTTWIKRPRASVEIRGTKITGVSTPVADALARALASEGSPGSKP